MEGLGSGIPFRVLCSSGEEGWGLCWEHKLHSFPTVRVCTHNKSAVVSIFDVQTASEARVILAQNPKHSALLNLFSLGSRRRKGGAGFEELRFSSLPGSLTRAL